LCDTVHRTAQSAAERRQAKVKRKKIGAEGVASFFAGAISSLVERVLEEGQQV